LFRAERISKIILVDEPPLCLINDSNPDGFTDNGGLVELQKSVLNNTVEATKGFVDMMVITADGKKAYAPWVLEESLKFPAKDCAFLLMNHVYTDWRDVIPTINIPTLVVAARNSHVKVAGNEWTHRAIKGSRLETFETAHMMFLEEPEKFNAVVEDFIG
jgi:pimeloyl-ACP methyl ester carboxylesterase